MSSIPLKPEDALRLVTQWRVTGEVLKRIHIRALANQSIEESRQSALDMLDFASQLPEDPARLSTSGLIEMQRLFTSYRSRGGH